MNFEGKNILVVGGSSGIGLETVKELRRLRANVFNASRRESGVDGVVEIPLDVTSEFKVIDVPDVLDGLVYCPGTINLKPFVSLKIQDFLNDFEVNVLGAVKVVQSVWKKLKASQYHPGIVLFSTVAVNQGMNFHASIATAKGALEGLTKSLAAEYSKYGIRVNSIAPSLTDTPLAKNLLSNDEKRKASEDRHPLKTIGEASTLAANTVYLLSENAKWTTGQILHIDGGMSSIRPL